MIKFEFDTICTIDVTHNILNMSKSVAHGGTPDNKPVYWDYRLVSHYIANHITGTVCDDFCNHKIVVESSPQAHRITIDSFVVGDHVSTKTLIFYKDVVFEHVVGIPDDEISMYQMDATYDYDIIHNSLLFLTSWSAWNGFSDELVRTMTRGY